MIYNLPKYNILEIKNKSEQIKTIDILNKI